VTTRKTNQPNPRLWPKTAERTPPLELRRAPLLAAACWFAMGETLAQTRQPTILLATATALLSLLVLVALRRSPRTAVIPLSALWIAIGCWCTAMQPSPSAQLAMASYADGLSRQLRGRIVRVRSLPSQHKSIDQDKETGWWPEKEADEESSSVDRISDTLSIDIQVDSIEEVTPDISRMVPIAGGVRLNILPDKITRRKSPTNAAEALLPELKCGDTVEAPMRIKLPERYRDPGAWQYADYLLAQGIGATTSVRAAKINLTRQYGVGPQSYADRVAQWQCQIYATQSWASERLLAYVRSRANRRLPSALRITSDDAGMLNAMLFGDRARLNRTQRVGFERTGSFHLFVVSGMHVGLLAGMVFWLTRRLKLQEWLASLVTTAITFGYALLTGFGAPVQRALFMTSVFLIARLLSRDRNVMNALGAAALAVLIWSPEALYEASFQMTFLAIIAIGGIAIPLGDRTFIPYARAAEHLWDKWKDFAIPPREAQFRLMLRFWSETIANTLGGWSFYLPSLLVRGCLWALELSLIGVIAEMVMTLPMAFYFHRATIFAVPTNMLSVPLVAALAPIAVVTFCASLISPWLAMLPGAATALLLHGIAAVIGRISSVHAADLRVPAPAQWIALSAVAAWALSCWAVRRSRNWAWAATALLPVAALALLWPERALVSTGLLEVTALDVGQGDSIFIVAPDGKTMLIDAGGPVGAVTEAAEASSRFDIGEEVVSPYLWSRRVRRLDVVVLSHAHSDHMGGMPAVLRNFRPRELWVSIDPNSDAYRTLIKEANDLGVQVRHLYAGDEVVWGGTLASILAPEPNYTNLGQPVNNDSLVLKLQYKKSSVLLEGDAEAPSEHSMLTHGRVTQVTLLKIGHHGSRTSTTQEFFNAAAPKDAVVSVGKGNTFGHPRYEVIERIAAARTKLYRTDEFGLTTFLLGPDGHIREIVGSSTR
jgi:competence protein ComEC